MFGRHKLGKHLVLRVGQPAGFVLAAGGWTVCVVDEDVIVAGATDDAVNRFAELLMARILSGVLATRQRPVHCHFCSPRDA